MSTQINFYVDNVLGNPPKNWQELALELNFDQDQEIAKAQVTVNEWELVRENNDDAHAYFENGLSGGLGVFEGRPLRIEIVRNGQIEIPFNGYIDYSDAPTFGRTMTNVKAKEINIDWLNDRAEFPFQYLYEVTGEIKNTDFVFVPYVINPVEDYKEVVVSLLTTIVLAQQILDSINNLARLAAEMANPFEATAIIRAVIYISYLVILIASIIKFIKDFINLLIQPVKYHATMRYADLLRIGAAHLGLTFKSEIFETLPYSKAVVMPEKYYVPKTASDNRIFGYLTPNKIEQSGYFKGTFGDLLREVKSMFNAKLIVTVDHELYLVRQDYNISSPSYQLPPLDHPSFSLNTDELYGTYLVQFQTDGSDKNTVIEYTGTAYEVVTRPIRTVNPLYTLIKGEKQVNIGFALAKRKTELTTSEKIIKEFLKDFSLLGNGLVSAVNVVIQIYNTVTKAINSIIKALKVVGIKIGFQIKPVPTLKFSSLGNLIENRIGMLKIETDLTNLPKVFLLDIGSEPKYNKIPANNDIYFSAKYLHQNFHFVNSFVPSASKPNANQYLIYQFQNIPFTFKDYLAVKNCNKVFDSKGNEAWVTSLKWNVHNQTADGTYRINKLYTNNLMEIILEPNGS